MKSRLGIPNLHSIDNMLIRRIYILTIVPVVYLIIMTLFLCACLCEALKEALTMAIDTFKEIKIGWFK